MATDLTPRVLEARDSEYYERDSGKLRRVTIVTFKLGDHGPFRAEFDQDGFTESALRDAMSKKADALRAF